MEQQKKRKPNYRPIKLAIWGDYHTLGIFCKKADIVDYAKKNISMLRKPGERLRLFELGMSEADQWSFTDISYEIHLLREQTGERFDAYIHEHSGFRVLTEIKAAISDAEDWEDEETIESGRRVMDRMFKVK